MTKKTILFVDDDENVISGIQRQLRPFRELWELFFVYNGADALALMEKQRIDLIVSDMMMPGMRGYELLKAVAEQHPFAVRMVLSGFADEASLKLGWEVAHQYLSKPCSAEMLREAISQVFKIQACVNNPLIVEGVGNAQNLPSLPQIYHELNAAMSNDNTTVQHLADIFAKDMVLSAKLLHLINSPYFGMNRVISNLNEAINLLGVKKLNNLLVSVHVKAAFPVNDRTTEKYMEYLWKDAGRVAELARQIAIAENQEGDRPDQAYLGGLLHNMGLLIFLSRGGEKLKTFLRQLETSKTQVDELETAVFGFTRSEAAAYVLSLWKIPPRIIEAILLQNQPNDTEYDGVNALTAVHVAACLLKPTLTIASEKRLFEMNLNNAYLQRIKKAERLPIWQELADKILAQSLTAGK